MTCAIPFFKGFIMVWYPTEEAQIESAGWVVVSK
jgi:hypothetical protein